MIVLPCFPIMMTGVSGYRHWRIYTTVTNSTISQILAEVEFRDEIGGPSVAVGGTATADAFSSGNSPGNAFDGDSTTSWVHSSPTAPNWIAYEFAEAVDIKEVALQAFSSGTAFSRMPVDFEVQRSDDGLTWDTVLSVTGQTGWGSGEKRTYAL